jgi:hypothetical protein
MVILRPVMHIKPKLQLEISFLVGGVGVGVGMDKQRQQQ